MCTPPWCAVRCGPPETAEDDELPNNFDFPSKPKLFVHRAGRAARAGRTGRALSLVEHEELPYLVDLMLYLGRNLTPVPIGGEGAADEGGADDVELGVLPSTRLEAEVEYINGLMRETPELGARTRARRAALLALVVRLCRRLYLKRAQITRPQGHRVSSSACADGRALTAGVAAGWRRAARNRRA